MHTSTVVSTLQIERATGSGQYFELLSLFITTTVENKRGIVFVCMAAIWLYAAIVISALQIHVTSAGGDGLELQSRAHTTIVENNRFVVRVCHATTWMQTAATFFVLKVEIRSWHNKQQKVGAFHLYCTHPPTCGGQPPARWMTPSAL